MPLPSKNPPKIFEKNQGYSNYTMYCFTQLISLSEGVLHLHETRKLRAWQWQARFKCRSISITVNVSSVDMALWRSFTHESSVILMSTQQTLGPLSPRTLLMLSQTSPNLNQVRVRAYTIPSILIQVSYHILPVTTMWMSLILLRYFTLLFVYRCHVLVIILYSLTYSSNFLSRSKWAAPSLLPCGAWKTLWHFVTKHFKHDLSPSARVKHLPTVKWVL